MQSFFIYMLTFIWTAVSARILKVDKKRNVIVVFILLSIIFMPIIYIYGFRYNVGVDYPTYLAYYRHVMNYGDMSIKDIPTAGFELGYVVLNIIASRLIKEEYGIFLIIGAAMCALLWNGLHYYRENLKIYQGIFIFFFVYFGTACNVARQMLAVLVILGSFKYIEKQEFFKFLIRILIASLFHKSALFCILFYLLKNCMKNQKQLYYLKLTMIISSILVFPLSSAITYLLDRFEMYSVHSTYGGVGMMSGMKFLLYVIPMLCFIEFFEKDLLYENRKYQIYIAIYYFQIPLQCLGTFNSVMERMALYCSIVQVILIPLIIKSIRNKSNRMIANMFCYSWYFIYFVVMEIVLSGNGIGKYQFIH